MKLSEAESRGVKVVEPGSVQQAREPQAMMKLLSDKQALPEAIEKSVGRVWCPIQGTDCSEVGENLFLITFKQASGKKKALEEGPRMFYKEMVVLEDFDPDKTLDEYSFTTVPIWVCVLQAYPLGE
ncbi:unnamed protein product [Alopecurus aequalis]